MILNLKIVRNTKGKIQKAEATDFSSGEKAQGKKYPAKWRWKRGAGCGADGQIGRNSGAGKPASPAHSPSPPSPHS